MAENLSEVTGDDAVYLPAMQVPMSTALVGSPHALRKGRWPHGLRMGDLNWLDPDCRVWHYDSCLASAGLFMNIARANSITQRKPGTRVVGDSGGYQIGTGALGATKDWQPQRKKVAYIKQSWLESDIPYNIMRWLDCHCDYAMTIDMPLWVRGKSFEHTAFHYLSQQDLIDLTLHNLQIIADHRDTQTGARYLNVLQAFSASGDRLESLQSEDAWFDAVKGFPFDGWAWGGEVAWRGGVYRILRRLLILRDGGLLAHPRNWCHILGVGSPMAAVTITSMQRAIRKYCNADFRISFDSSSAALSAGRFVQYCTMPVLDGDLKNWSTKWIRFPTGYEVANDPSPRRFEVDSPIARKFTLQELNPSKDAMAAVTMDALASHIIINHNTYVQLKSIAKANDVAFRQGGACPQQLSKVFELIDQLFASKNWQQLLDDNRAMLDGLFGVKGYVTA
jgi:hypothetical protein